MADRVTLFRDANSVLAGQVAPICQTHLQPPGTQIIALSPGDWPDPFYSELARQSDLPYAEIFGPVLSREAATVTESVSGPARGAAARADSRARARCAAWGPVRRRRTGPACPGHRLRMLPAGDLLSRAPGRDISVGACTPALSASGSHLYLEIGTQHRQALALARCPSVAIDPYLLLREPVVRGKPELHMFRTSSDMFFARHDLMRTLRGSVVRVPRWPGASLRTHFARFHPDGTLRLPTHHGADP
jgi:hypothetical protein